MFETHIALLRGINVGGKNKLPMKDLAQMFEAAGCKNVRTYIQSGNVIFEAPPKIAAAIPHAITAAIEKKAGHKIPVIVRTATQLADALAQNPFLKQGSPEDTLHLMFLADAPTSAQIAALDPHRSSPDAFVVVGNNLYLHLPNGAARTKLTNAYFDSKLATVGTMRNWRTVLKLAELATS